MGVALTAFNFFSIYSIEDLYNYNSVYFPIEYKYVFYLICALLLTFLFSLNSRIKKGATYLIAALILVLYVFTIPELSRSFYWRKYSATMEELNGLACGDMPKILNQDIEEGNLKYFAFGNGSSPDFDEKMADINITVYNLGCCVQDELMCYNELLLDYMPEIKVIEKEVYDSH